MTDVPYTLTDEATGAVLGTYPTLREAVQAARRHPRQGDPLSPIPAPKGIVAGPGMETRRYSRYRQGFQVRADCSHWASPLSGGKPRPECASCAGKRRWRERKARNSP